MPTQPPPEDVADVVGLPADRLWELDRRALTFLLLRGRFQAFTLRDRETGRTFDVSLDRDTNSLVDEEALRTRDRELVSRHAPALAPALRDLLLRHPELGECDIRILGPSTTPGEAGGHERLQSRIRQVCAEAGLERQYQRDAHGVIRTSLPVAQILQLAKGGDVTRIELAAEPEILDED